MNILSAHTWAYTAENVPRGGTTLDYIFGFLEGQNTGFGGFNGQIHLPPSPADKSSI